MLDELESVSAVSDESKCFFHRSQVKLRKNLILHFLKLISNLCNLCTRCYVNSNEYIKGVINHASFQVFSGDCANFGHS